MSCLLVDSRFRGNDNCRGNLPTKAQLEIKNLKLEIDLPNGFAQQKSPLLVESCAIVMIKPGVTQLEQEDFYIDKHPPLCHPCESRPACRNAFRTSMASGQAGIY